MTINIDPVIGYIGGIEIRWYSLAIMAAVVSAVVFALFEAKRKGISLEKIVNGVPWALVGGILGARFFHILDHWSYYMANPSLIFAFQRGGLAIWGALVGGAAGVFAYTQVARIPFLRIADVVTPGLLLAQIIGRFGCIVNGDAYGSPTTLPWGFIYTNPDAMIPYELKGIPTHPYPVYDMLWSILTLSLVLVFRRRFKQDGLAFAFYLGTYAVGRFILSYVRLETVLFAGLQEAQIVALGILAAAVALGFFLVKRQRRLEAAAV